MIFQLDFVAFGLAACNLTEHRKLAKAYFPQH